MKQEATRICPECKNTITYKTIGHRNEAERKNRTCRKCKAKRYIPPPNAKCSICEKPIYRVRTRLTGNNFCSIAHRNAFYSKENSFAWKGGREATYQRSRIWDKKRKAEKKIKALLLLGSKCSICGYDKCSDAIDFHHRNPLEKDETLKNLWAQKWETIENEIKKCVLLCSNCHREHHWKERQNASIA